jgi:hypothetical protein
VKVKSALLAALSFALSVVAPLAGAQEQVPKSATAPQPTKLSGATQRTQPTAAAPKDAATRAQPVKSNREAPAAPEPVSTKPKSGGFDSKCNHARDSDA